MLLNFITGALAALFCVFLVRLWHRRKSRASLSIDKFAPSVEGRYPHDPPPTPRGPWQCE